MEAHFEVLMALVFPYTVTGVPEERRRAVQLLAGGTMAGLLTGRPQGGEGRLQQADNGRRVSRLCQRMPAPGNACLPACLPATTLTQRLPLHAAQELDALIRSRPVPVIAQLLLMARGGVEEGAAEPARPFFSGRLLVEAVHSLMRRATLEENQRALWEVGGRRRGRGWAPAEARHAAGTNALPHLAPTALPPTNHPPLPSPVSMQLLMPDHLARILLALHAHLELAAHPRHQAAALAPLRAALALMGDRVCDPAAFRYTAAVLLRLLPVRWVAS